MKSNNTDDNINMGWISLYRSIKNHWVFENDQFFKWWILILFEVNHTTRKFNRNYNVYEVKKGQSNNCLRTWSEIFKTTPKTVSRFFKLLEKDNMLKIEKIGKGKQALTLITVINYEQYQTQSKQTLPQEVNKPYHTGYTQSKQTLPTNNNVNNLNNGNNKNNVPPFSDFLEYAKSKKPTVSVEALKFKYEAWIANGWKDGNDKKIKNWKSKLLHTLPHIKTESNTNKFQNPII